MVPDSTLKKDRIRTRPHKIFPVNFDLKSNISDMSDDYKFYIYFDQTDSGSDPSEKLVQETSFETKPCLES